MNKVARFPQLPGFVSALGTVFRHRELFLHDGTGMRRVSVSARAQIASFAAAFCLTLVAAFGIVQFAAGSASISRAIADFGDRQARVAQLEAQLASLEADLAAVKKEARVQAARLEAGQAFLASVVKGEGNPEQLGKLLPAREGKPSAIAAEVAAYFDAAEAGQDAVAAELKRKADARYAELAGLVTRIGFAPARFDAPAGMTGVGGPYEPVPADMSSAVSAAGSPSADPQFKALFHSWRRLDQLQTGIASIPSLKPVDQVTVNSGFGVRSDPFRGGRAMHAGVDIPGAHATRIYATADGFVGRSGWVGGYGNMVELDHGRGIQTRYGHLSSILVTPGQRVKRGQLVGLMGSTGRSTGTHLHYEVRIDGRAINPVPFLQTAEYLQAMQSRTMDRPLAMGGPASKDAGSK